MSTKTRKIIAVSWLVTSLLFGSSKTRSFVETPSFTAPTKMANERVISIQGFDLLNKQDSFRVKVDAVDKVLSVKSNHSRPPSGRWG